MSQQRAKFTIADFRGGINSDVSPLQSSHEQARTIDNFVIGSDGSLQRRLGLHSVAQFDLPKLASSEDISLGLHSNILRGSNIKSILWRSFGLGDEKIVALNIGGGVVGFYTFNDLLNFTERAKLVVESAAAFPVPIMTAFKKTLSGATAPLYDPTAGDVTIINVTGNNVNGLDMLDVFENLTGTSPDAETQVIFNVTGSIRKTGVNAPAAVRTQSWPSGAQLRLNNFGVIWGAPGAPKGAQLIEANAPLPVGIISNPNNTGGDAVDVQHPMTINNQGEIASGGGPGGGVFFAASGRFGTDPDDNFISVGISAAGGRGAGRSTLTGNPAYESESRTDNIDTNDGSLHSVSENKNLATSAAFGNLAVGRPGRTFEESWFGLIGERLRVEMAGGAGGNLGQPGQAGNFDEGRFDDSTQGFIDSFWIEQPGGDPGIAVKGTSDVTFVSTGTIIGPTET